MEPKGITRKKNKNAMFNCQATSDESTLLQISWQHNREPVDCTQTDKCKILANNSLLITHTNHHNAGMYTCIASNGFSNASKDAMLTILDNQICKCFVNKNDSVYKKVFC
jgi:hypothetical protein